MVQNGNTNNKAKLNSTFKCAGAVGGREDLLLSPEVRL